MLRLWFMNDIAFVILLHSNNNGINYIISRIEVYEITLLNLKKNRTSYYKSETIRVQVSLTSGFLNIKQSRF